MKILRCLAVARVLAPAFGPAAYAQEFPQPLTDAEISVTEGFEDEGSGFPILPVVAGIFGLAGFGIWRNRRASRTCPSCGAVALRRKRETIAAPTRTEPGGLAASDLHRLWFHRPAFLCDPLFQFFQTAPDLAPTCR